MGTRSSLENFNSSRTEYTVTRTNRRPVMQSTLQTIPSVEKALSMNSINEQVILYFVCCIFIPWLLFLRCLF
jgi:hypothetical protein